MLPIPFGNPATYKGHSGVDYGQPRGTPFRASGNGVVKSHGSNSRGGNYIWVGYDGYPDVGYHHMDSHIGCPRVGTRIVEGTILGYVGNTGNSTGPHLHSEVAGYATTAGYWKFFDRNRVVRIGGSGAAVTPEKKELDMNVKLWLYTPTNSLILIDHLNKTMRNLGNNGKSLERAAFDNLPYTKIAEPVWTQTFKDFTYI